MNYLSKLHILELGEKNHDFVLSIEEMEWIVKGQVIWRRKCRES